MRRPDRLLRPARPEDAAACADILGRWIAETPWMPNLHTGDENRAFCARLIAEHATTVCCGDGVEGFLTRDGVKVLALYVSGAARGQGVGKALLDAAKRDAPRLSLWTLQANEGARRFYAREGFVETEMTEDGNEERLPDVCCRWAP